MKSLLGFSLTLAILITGTLGSAITQQPSNAAASLSAPPASAPSTAPSNDTVEANRCVCIRNRNPFSLRNLIKSQCDHAISLLPQDPAQGTFHTENAGAEDEYKLPAVRTSQNCQVIVGLDYGYDTEVGTWPAVNAQAYTLSAKCCGTRASNGLLGGNREGWVPAGDHAKIKVTLIHYRPPWEENATVADAVVAA